MDDRHVIVGVWRDSDIQRIGYVLKLIMSTSSDVSESRRLVPFLFPHPDTSL